MIRHPGRRPGRPKDLTHMTRRSLPARIVAATTAAVAAGVTAALVTTSVGAAGADTDGSSDALGSSLEQVVPDFPAPVSLDITVPDGTEQPFISGTGVLGRFLTWNADAPASHGLLVWLHGDGGYEYDNPDSPEYLGGPDGIRAVAEARDMRLIVPKTPAVDGTWWRDGATNAGWLGDLVDRERRGSGTVHLAGFSGGAETITRHVLPALGSHGVTDGSAVLFGGGGAPVDGTDAPKSSVPGDFPLTWLVGASDDGSGDNHLDALTASARGADYYTAHGWQTRRETVAGQSHLLRTDGTGLYGRLLGSHL